MAPNRKTGRTSFPSRTPKQSRVSETEQDFAEEADEAEASAGKWKAGDVDRSLRFYRRALDAYNRGLAAHPRSFDLAYNKALLLYNLSQDKTLQSILGPSIQVLQEALQAHEFAMSLGADNADVLFNTAQVMTSLAEEITEESEINDQALKTQAISLLQKAVELFDACFSLQEKEYTELLSLESRQPEAQDHSPHSSEITADGNDGVTREQTEQWAVVNETVTPQGLVDTALAQLYSLSSLAAASAPSSEAFLENLVQIAKPLVEDRLPRFIRLLPTFIHVETKESTQGAYLSISTSASTFHDGAHPAGAENPRADAEAEAEMAMSSFSAAIAGAKYMSTLFDVDEYYRTVREVLEPMCHKLRAKIFSPALSLRVCSACVDLATEFCENIEERSHSRSSAEDSAVSQRWKMLTSADASIGDVMASPLHMSTREGPTPAQLMFARGGLELRRWRLSLLDTASTEMTQSGKILLKNARSYYATAVNLSARDGSPELQQEARFRHIFATAVLKELEIGSHGSAADELSKQLSIDVLRERLQEMVHGGVITEDMSAALLERKEGAGTQICT